MQRILLGVAVFAAVGFAQTQTFTANVRGGASGDRGKCTIEVEVDGVAEVEIRGDRGMLRTLQGQPATWRRFDCNMAPPRNMADFRFKGIDGRGRQTLVRDPGSNGIAVVRLEDPQGGREGYTFDIEWRGTAGYNNSPWDNDRRNNPGNRGWGNDRRDDRPSSRFDVNRTVRLCQDMVAARARREFNVRNPDFRNTDTNDLRGNRDRVSGEFNGNRGERYEYSCSVNLANGEVRNAEVRRRR
jgi:hypothetical protein